MGALTFTPSAPFRHQELADDAVVDGFEFHRRLVGLDLGQDIAGADGIALRHQPFDQIALLHRRATARASGFASAWDVPGRVTARWPRRRNDVS